MAIGGSLTFAGSEETTAASLADLSTEGSDPSPASLAGAGTEVAVGFEGERWTGINLVGAIEPALFMSNMSIGIGTSIEIGDASLVLVQIAASDERVIEIAPESDLN